MLGLIVINYGATGSVLILFLTELPNDIDSFDMRSSLCLQELKGALNLCFLLLEIGNL